MRPRPGADPVLFTTNLVIRSLARRIQGLNDEIRTIDAMLGELELSCIQRALDPVDYRLVGRLRSEVSKLETRAFGRP